MQESMSEITRFFYWPTRNSLFWHNTSKKSANTRNINLTDKTWINSTDSERGSVQPMQPVAFL